MSNLNSLNISNEQVLLINILNTMYNENLRQIQILYESNNQIRQTISDLLFDNRITRNNSNRNRNNSNHIRNNSNRNRRNINNNYRNNSSTYDIYEDYIRRRNNNSNINDNEYLNRHNNTSFSVYSSPISYLPRRNLINRNEHSRLAVEITNQARNAANIARNSANIARNSANVARSQIQHINLNNIESNMTSRSNDRINTNANNNNITRLIESFLQPIDIYPTTAQIEASTRVTRYGNIIRPVNTSCPISLEPFNDTDLVTMIRHCGHIFNTNEINSWFRSNCRCPVCRYDIRNYLSDPSNAQNFINDNEETERDTSQQHQDISGNLVNNVRDSLTDNLTGSILNDVLNQSGLTTSNSERLIHLLDPSNNSFDVLTTLYYLFPASNQYRI